MPSARVCWLRLMSTYRAYTNNIITIHIQYRPTHYDWSTGGSADKWDEPHTK